MQKETLQTFVNLDATKAWLPQSHIASGTPSEVSGCTEVPTTLAPQQTVKHSQIVNRGSEEGEGSDTRLRCVTRQWAELGDAVEEVRGHDWTVPSKTTPARSRHEPALETRGSGLT